MLKGMAIGLVVVVAAVLVYAATRPDSFRVERSVTVKAPPERIFALIDDLHAFNTWNPFEKKDPGLKGSYSGPASGNGAAYAWGSAKVGTGRMEIVEAVPASQVTMKLDFLEPFAAHNTAEFVLVPRGETTEVTWAMHGPNPYLAKLVQTFFSMDSMVGGDFEAGLAELKVIAER